MRYVLPRMVARAAAFARSCVRRWLFWVLLVLLSGLVFVEKRLRPEDTSSTRGGIHLTEEGQTVGSFGGAMDVEPEPTVAADPSTLLGDAHRRWWAAYAQRDTALLRRLYALQRLDVQREGSAEEGERAFRLALSLAGPNRILCDSAWTTAVELPRATTVAVFTREDSATLRVSSEWLHSDAVWQITKQQYGEWVHDGSAE
jgi:hypothetical protein